MSGGKALPLLFICMCTFVANDLDDLEKDQINHPDRPLPARQLTVEIAAVLYFVVLAAALFSTRHFVTQGIAFWYYGLMTLSISYGYVVECLPSFKTVYVAIASSIPVLIVATTYPDEPQLRIAAGCVFLFTLGREICGDILDRDGDAESFLHRFRPPHVALFAFLVEILGLVLLAMLIRHTEDVIVLAAMALLLAISGVYWFRLGRGRLATFLLKIQLFVGLYFLL
ncbi:MAG TPA: UbiA family prenyltransferase [Pyrinomonadaceae bacterium]|nr:UbiA family prenyltransferase [Pyrinomonadaceae bacterium]